MEDKTYTVYTHRVVTEDNGPMYYTGITTNVKNRWIQGKYKTTALWLYIEKYGWDNIEHVVVFETGDREKALKTEDMLICGYAALGRCINEHRSGLIKALDRKAYNRKRMRDKYSNDQEYAERRRQRDRDRYRNDQEYSERRRQHDRDRYRNDPEYAERQRRIKREKLATPEGKIYDRVKKFNYYHPDLAIESPLEARDKYLATGYIPQYIKHDDI